MAEEISTIEDLLQKLELVVCDTSMMSGGEDSSWFQEKVYLERSFSGIELDSMLRKIENFNYFLFLLGNPNVITVPGVSSELRMLRDLVSDKIRYLGGMESMIAQKVRRKSNGHGFRKREIGRAHMEEIRDLLHQCYLQARRITFSPEDKEKYSLLEGEVIEIAKRTNSKIDLRPNYLKRFKPKIVEDLHTDEQLVAAAIYSFRYDNKDVGILTRDSDIRRIMRKSVSSGELDNVLRLSETNHRRLRVFGFSFQGELRCEFDSLR